MVGLVGNSFWMRLSNECKWFVDANLGAIIFLFEAVKGITNRAKSSFLCLEYQLNLGPLK